MHCFPSIIGRDPEAEVTIDDRWVSRRHCIIEMTEDGNLIVRDLGSKHGTFVNNQQIDEAPLCPGDKLGIGMTSFLISYPAGSIAESASSQA